MRNKQTLLYAKHDSIVGPMILVDEQRAKQLNQQGYGIFRTVNGFQGRRQIQCLTQINGWGTDIDEGEKVVQLKKINAAPLEPSWVVETKRGHQLIYFARNATQENYKTITKYCLVPFFNGDSNACDLARVLREPGFYHLKDPEHPFLIKLIHESDAAYTEAEMLKAFPLHKPANIKNSADKTKNNKHQSNLVSRKFKVSQIEALEKISGCPEVKFEHFSFQENYNGTKQILVNNKPTSSWIDNQGSIGSYDEGGPTVCEWLSWYGNSKEVIRALLNKLHVI